MRKFLMVGIIVLLVISILNILSLSIGIYIPFEAKADIKCNAIIQNNKIIYKGQEIEIKGVEMSAAYPGYNFSDYMITQKQYLKWFEEISEMGANTIRATNRLNPEFYNALYEYNENAKEKLYLIQSIELEEYDMNNSKSIHGYKDKMLRECLIAIDIIHGNRYIATSGIAGQGIYRKDVSEYTLGYIITKIGDYETIAFTDNTDVKNKDKEYDGKYFKTKEGSSETEKIIAEIMDKIIDYETKKYNEQKLVSLTTEMLNDPLKYNESINIQMDKVAYINMNNVVSKDTLKSGKIVSYNLSYVADHFTQMTDEKNSSEIKNILNIVNKETLFGGYIDFISKFYNSPVLISSFGFSTSRMIESTDQKQITEKEQGEAIVDYYNGFINLNIVGAIITSWQDNWSLSSWNTTYSTEKDKEIYWHNKQSVNQSFGILEFQPENKKDICMLDGSIEEWNEENLISENDGKKIYAKYDFENLYIMVTNINEGELVYVPIDTTPKSGANKYKNIDFDRGVDFLIRINGKNDSQILVQEYYDSTRAIYEEDITGEKQFANKPLKDSDEFVSMRAMLKREIDTVANVKLMNIDERKTFKMYSTINTGKLIHGNDNPNSEDYNSLADFMYGENCVEIQIPWGLLNFSAPSEMLIHDDYYQNYGIENQKINSIYLGIGINTSDKIILEKFKLKPWKRNVEVQERLKESYYIIKNAWSDK